MATLFGLAALCGVGALVVGGSSGVVTEASRPHSCFEAFATPPVLENGQARAYGQCDVLNNAGPTIRSTCLQALTGQWTTIACSTTWQPAPNYDVVASVGCHPNATQVQTYRTIMQWGNRVESSGPAAFPC